MQCDYIGENPFLDVHMSGQETTKEKMANQSRTNAKNKKKHGKTSLYQQF